MTHDGIYAKDGILAIISAVQACDVAAKLFRDHKSEKEKQMV